MIVRKVELSPSVMEGVSVPLSWEIEPFRVTELVAFEIEVAFTSEGVDEKTVVGEDQPSVKVQNRAERRKRTG